MAMSAFGVEDNRLSKADHRASGRSAAATQSGGPAHRTSGSGLHRSQYTRGGEIRATASQPFRNAGAAGRRGMATAGAMATQVRGDVGDAASRGREAATQYIEPRVSAQRELAGARAGRAADNVKAAGKWARSDYKTRRGVAMDTAGSMGRSAVGAVKLHPVRAGAIGAGITGAGAGIAYGVHRHNRSKLDQ